MAGTDRFALPSIGLWAGALDVVQAVRARELAVELEKLTTPVRRVLAAPRPRDLTAGRREVTPASTWGQPNYVNSLLELGFAEADLTGGGTDKVVDGLVAGGDEEAILARVREHLDVGADHVAVQALPTEKRGVPDAQRREPAPSLTGLTK